jgi:hypothetical protein
MQISTAAAATCEAKKIIGRCDYTKIIVAPKPKKELGLFQSAADD